MITLCDLQIVAGIGILVSAYGSLKTGISAYHWEIAVYLAWFANLSHLTCLTFLRKHLHGHTRERTWRVVSMVVIFLLLLVAQAPTAYFDWPSAGVSAANASSSALCFFHLPTANARLAQAYAPNEAPELSTTDAGTSVIISSLLLAFNLGTRIIKLSSTLSSVINGQVRARASSQVQLMIHKMHEKCILHYHPRRRLYKVSANLLVVRPAICCFLVCRLYADLYSSMLSEVSFQISLIPTSVSLH
jgi:hypothetical protein